MRVCIRGRLLLDEDAGLSTNSAMYTDLLDT